MVHVYNAPRGRRLVDAEGFDPNEPRDPDGKWTSGGGGGGSVPSGKTQWVGSNSSASPKAKKETASAVLGGIKPDAPSRIELPHSKGIPRKDMPQILREDRPALLKKLTEAGYKVSEGIRLRLPGTSSHAE